MEGLSSRSLARVLSDIAAVLSSGDGTHGRLTHAMDLLARAVPYSACALITVQPEEMLCICPPHIPAEALRETAMRLLRKVQETSDDSREPPSLPTASQLAVPLVDPDVRVVGLLLLVRESRAYEEVDLRVLTAVAGQLACYVAWLQHRHEKAQLLERERAARVEADQASRAKDAFLATLSHELRSPLTAILGWSDMLLAGSLPADTAARALQAINRNARTQAHLIDDALDVSRIISGKFLVEKRVIDLNTVIGAAVDAIRPLAERKHIAVIADASARPLPLTADPNRLQQVFANLLSNAVKFTPDGGRIRVEVATHDDRVEIAVADTGIGIDPQVLPHVFDRFFQQDSSKTRADAGLGLGLAIVKHIVAQHGGAVRVDSHGEGTGTTFTVVLKLESTSSPLASSEQAAADEVDKADPQFRLDGVSVLVVDDSADTREMLTTLLVSRGAAVQVAASAREALECLGVAPPHVIVSDVAMPEIDGLAFIRQLRESGTSIPAIALSAHGRVEDQARAVSAGFNIHLTKPAMPHDLVAAIAALLGSSGQV